jgi:predicted kinase
MTTLVVSVGVSGSGKTTVGREFEAKGFKVVCPDDVRKKLGGMNDFTHEGIIWSKIVPDSLQRNLKKGNVYYSATNCKESAWNKIRKWVADLDVKIVWLVFSGISEDELIRRVQHDIDTDVERSNTIANEAEPIKRQLGEMATMMSQMKIDGNTLKELEAHGWIYDFGDERVVFYAGQTVDEILNG